MDPTKDLQRKLLFIEVGRRANESCLWESAKRFFSSPIGGGWSDDEVTAVADSEHLKASIASRIRESAEADYCVVLCIGKTMQFKVDRPWKESHLMLPDGERISERELNPGCSKVLLLFDGQDFGFYNPVKGAKKQCCGETTASSRRTYDEAINAAEEGIAKLSLNTSEKHPTGELSLLGALITTAEDWAEANTGVLTFDGAIELMQERNDFAQLAQHLQHAPGRRLRHFPLAVA